MGRTKKRFIVLREGADWLTGPEDIKITNCSDVPSYYSNCGTILIYQSLSFQLLLSTSFLWLSSLLRLFVSPKCPFDSLCEKSQIFSWQLIHSTYAKSDETNVVIVPLSNFLGQNVHCITTILSTWHCLLYFGQFIIRLWIRVFTSSSNALLCRDAWRDWSEMNWKLGNCSV